jgi:hypothetical protein
MIITVFTISIDDNVCELFHKELTEIRRRWLDFTYDYEFTPISLSCIKGGTHKITVKDINYVKYIHSDVQTLLRSKPIYQDYKIQTA